MKAVTSRLLHLQTPVGELFHDARKEFDLLSCGSIDAQDARAESFKCATDSRGKVDRVTVRHGRISNAGQPEFTSSPASAAAERFCAMIPQPSCEGRHTRSQNADDSLSSFPNTWCGSRWTRPSSACGVT